ncbi:MAG: hypothetical protein ABW166_13800 [Sedimenticola sp.]
MIKKYQIIILVSLLAVIGCSSEEGSATKSKSTNEHIFKDQVQAIEKAKEVELLLQNAANKQRKDIEEQTKKMR